VGYTHDVLVIGHGIAGAVVATLLRERGLRVHVFDRRLPGCASLAAAGVVNPVVLKRDVPSWRAAQLLPEAIAFYTANDRRLAMTTWHPLPLVKLFPTPHEADRWQRAMRHPGTEPFIDQRSQPEVDNAPLDHPHGHGTVHAAGWLDVPGFLVRLEECARAEGEFTGMEVTDDIIERFEGGIRIGAYTAPWTIRCTGAFHQLPGLVHVKGEGLTVHIPGLSLPCMIHRGVFLLPLGDDVYRVGATFAWDHVWSGLSEHGRSWLLEKLRAVTPATAEVIDHWWGVRPAAIDRRPIMGVIAPGEAVLNGLGSRGVLLAPWCARHLIEHLFDGEPLDPEVSVARFGTVA
jgi:glycine oxidase